MQQQQKYSVFTGVAILIIYVPKKDEVYCLTSKITCVYYILPDNRDSKSCQVGQGKDVAITTLPNQPSAFSVIKQSRDYLLAWTQCGIPLLGGFWSKTNYLIWAQIARQLFSAVYEMYCPELQQAGVQLPFAWT